MQNLLQIWLGLDGRKRLVVLGATVAMFLAVMAISRMGGMPGMSLLYAGLDSSAAGDVVTALDQKGVTYEVRGQAIYVDDSRRDSLRMTLAAEGLPANSGTGYELLDSLSGFGTTAQMFDAAYWRAKEGELSRTILSNPQIRAARVHIAQAPSQPFQRDVKPSASVTITSVGGSLPVVQANALRHLIAASVPGMVPDEVAVIDSVAGLIASGADQAVAGESKAAEIKQNVERLLAARVGRDKAVVEVAVDLVTDAEQITERSFDPQSRVAISTDNTQQTGSSTQPRGDVTVASNLPAKQTDEGGNGKSENSETHEKVNYEVSETNRQLVKAPGAVRKISVAVLVDGVPVTAADGTVSLQPRPEEELAILRELVTSAAGLDITRGDILTLKSLAFEPLPQAGEVIATSMFSFGEINLMTLIQTAVLALVALILGLFVIRPVLGSARPRQAELASMATLALPGGGSFDGQRVLTGEIDDGLNLPPLSVVSGVPGSEMAKDPMSRLRQLIEERQVESVEILRGWMEVEEEAR
ncbi:MAG: flagellar basal-body MS-ring/collar protein FliF [Cypionkella sp.]|uniref:flagellar basal-body MS-ring/collar protein FliF n=1 Tax=Cypionkella sp. TaxID=2811411 RepID=UPI002ABBA378|nr:flagellar basal-body MS-ring/collar protein FliF [Cypionkella sp.]MDZ4311947.1 flagellar basal-body MS-ring/collar protein FliF [Cypionkella sp.]